ncbi:MAG TPA: diguanylate cyclase [Permianibacter sp.]|nr:diguanylate cyclase [Permianibacter sp.]
MTLTLGVLGAGTNYLLLSPLPAPMLYLGGLFYLPVLLRYGLGYSLLCASLCQLPLITSNVFWLAGPELIALAWLMKHRHWSSMRAALIYWTSAGLLLSAIASWQAASGNMTVYLLCTVTPALSGIVLMALTQHTLALFPRKYNQSDQAISSALSHLLVVFAALPVLAFHVFASPLINRAALNEELHLLTHTERIAQERYQLLVERNLRGLQTLSTIIADQDPIDLARHEPLLNRLLGNLAEVFTIIIIDADGYAVAGAPAVFPDGVRVADARQYYGDRDYFIEAKQNHQPAVSYGIVGRRMNPEPLLSLVAPILDRNNQFRGLILGNLPLRRLQAIFLAAENDDRLAAVLYDRKQQVLYSSASLSLPVLTSLTGHSLLIHAERTHLPRSLGIGDDLRPLLWHGKLLQESGSPIGGGMMLLFDTGANVLSEARTSLITLLVLFCLILLARERARHYGRRLLTPLLDLHRHLQQLNPADVHRQQPIDIRSGLTEITDLVRSINGMMIRIAKNRLESDWAIAQKDALNADLDRRIAERTEQLASKAAELEQLSITDALTGLYNRRHLTAELNQEWERHVRNGTRVALLLFDADHFKSVNDRYGHPVGDEVLRQIGHSLREKIRGIDLAARYGGEEFAVLLPGIDASHALVVAERIRLGLAALTIDTELGPLQFTVSIGISDSDTPGLQDADSLLQRADQALYQAKQSGRNRCVIWRAVSAGEPPASAGPA